MRPVPRTMLSVFLILCCCGDAVAEESGSRFGWWPFGGEQEADASRVGSPAAAPADGPKVWLPPRPRFNLPEVHLPEVEWPTYELPQVHLPRPQLPSLPGKSEVDEARSAWTQKSADPAKPSPWQAVTDGAQRVTSSTRDAWRKTVDVLTPGDAGSARVAQHPAQAPWWKRMFAVEEKKPEGPRTVTEWMAQDRIDP